MMDITTYSTSSAAVVLLMGMAMTSNALSQEALHETIQSRQNEWASAFNQEDTTALARFYELDAVLVPPGGQPVEGRSEILHLLASLYSQIDGLTLHTEDVVRLGDRHAVEVGYNVYDTVEEDGSTTSRSDNYIVVWQMDESGTWRYLREILNQRSTDSDQVPP